MNDRQFGFAYSISAFSRSRFYLFHLLYITHFLDQGTYLFRNDTYDIVDLASAKLTIKEGGAVEMRSDPTCWQNKDQQNKSAQSKGAQPRKSGSNRSSDQIGWQISDLKTEPGQQPVTSMSTSLSTEAKRANNNGEAAGPTNVLLVGSKEAIELWMELFSKYIRMKDTNDALAEERPRSSIGNRILSFVFGDVHLQFIPVSPANYKEISKQPARAICHISLCEDETQIESVKEDIIRTYNLVATNDWRRRLFFFHVDKNARPDAPMRELFVENEFQDSRIYFLPMKPAVAVEAVLCRVKSEVKSKDKRMWITTHRMCRDFTASILRLQPLSTTYEDQLVLQKLVDDQNMRLNGIQNRQITRIPEGTSKLFGSVFERSTSVYPSEYQLNLLLYGSGNAKAWWLNAFLNYSLSKEPLTEGLVEAAYSFAQFERSFVEMGAHKPRWPRYGLLLDHLKINIIDISNEWSKGGIVDLLSGVPTISAVCFVSMSGAKDSDAQRERHQLMERLGLDKNLFFFPLTLDGNASEQRNLFFHEKLKAAPSYNLPLLPLIDTKASMDLHDGHRRPPPALKKEWTISNLICERFIGHIQKMVPFTNPLHDLGTRDWANIVTSVRTMANNYLKEEDD
uniref:Death domain-containing protein n=1 Tax=Steinernema glaseri TaxID=37863 RepID=A0A1I8AI74_9BILA